MDDIRIRTASPDDAEALLAIYAPYIKETAITFEYEVPSAEEFAKRIRRTLMRHPYLVAERDGGILGYVYASPLVDRRAADWAVETSIYIAGGCRGLGLGRMLYEALEEALRRQNIISVNACIAAVPEDRDDDVRLNDSSIRFHTRMGYRETGRFRKCGYKFGQWYDLVWMSKLLCEHPDEPPAMIPYPQLSETSSLI